MREGKVGMLVTQDDLRSTDYSVRRTAADLNIPMVLNFRLAKALAAAFKDRHISVKELREYW
jgi:carbamoyl-phosphate synthase large subunit